MIKKYVVEIVNEETGVPVYVSTIDDWLHPFVPTFTVEKKCSFYFRTAYALASFLKRTYSQVMVVACGD